MGFYKDHFVPTLHNAIGGVITTVILAGVAGLVAFVKPIRDAVVTVGSIPVPLWVTIVIVISLVTVGLLRLGKVGKALSALSNEFAQTNASAEQEKTDLLRQIEEEKNKAVLAAQSESANELSRRDEWEEKMLLITAEKGRLRRSLLAAELGLHIVKIDYHLAELLNSNLIEQPQPGTTIYRLTHQGKAYLVKHDLLPK